MKILIKKFQQKFNQLSVNLLKCFEHVQMCTRKSKYSEIL